MAISILSFQPVRFHHSRYAGLFFSLLLLLAAGPGRAATLPTPYYSIGSGIAVVTNTGGAVANALNAADANLSTVATLTPSLLLGQSTSLRLGLSATAPAGYRAGLLMGSANSSQLANVSALGAVVIKTYLTIAGTPVLRETRTVPQLLLVSLLGAGTRPTQLEFTSSQSFDAVEITFNSALNVAYSTNIYYSYGVPAGIQTNASGYTSRFASPTGTEVSTRSQGGLLCVNTDILNQDNVASYSLTDYAELNSTASVGCNPILKTKLAGVPATGVPAGYYAGFIVSQGSVIDVSVLNNLKINTYRNGVLQESKSGSGNLLYRLLAGNKVQIAIPTNLAFDEVEIARTGALTALANLEVYYGFGFESAAFTGLNALRSDFASPQATDYSFSIPQVITVPLVGNVTLSRVDNPTNAADASSTNYATLVTTGLSTTVTNVASLRLALNPASTAAPTATRQGRPTATAAGLAGNRVGMVVQSGKGVVDAAALQNMTLVTYDASNQLVESYPGTQLLNTTLLDGTNRSAISFLASRDFTYVELIVSSLAAAGSVTDVYYAFVQDVPLLSAQFPLPVELSQFSGKWADEAAELSWSTASEKNSSYFVVERSVSGDGSYQAVGRVAAAGTSSSAHNYQLRDAAASHLNAVRLYYRLRQVDLDGRESFSPVVTLAAGKPAGLAQLELYPNPAAKATDVVLDYRNLPAGGGQLLAYSETGQLVYSARLGAGAARATLPALADGLYHVLLRDEAGHKIAARQLVVRNH